MQVLSQSARPWGAQSEPPPELESPNVGAGVGAAGRSVTFLYAALARGEMVRTTEATGGEAAATAGVVAIDVRRRNEHDYAVASL